ncbi:ABC transporter permease, partial [Rhizobium leguminosarum]
VIMALQPIPTYIIVLSLVILFGFIWPILPISYGAQVNLAPAFNWAFISSVIEHGILPALTLVLVGIGGWFISMRSL